MNILTFVIYAARGYVYALSDCDVIICSTFWDQDARTNRNRYVTLLILVIHILFAMRKFIYFVLFLFTLL